MREYAPEQGGRTTVVRFGCARYSVHKAGHLSGERKWYSGLYAFPLGKAFCMEERVMEFNESYFAKHIAPISGSAIRDIFKLLGKIRILKNVDEKIKKLDESLTNFHNCNKDLNKNKKLVVEVYVLTFVQLTILFLVPYCIARSFGQHGVKMFDMICAQSFVSMVSGLVPLPGGSGAAEYCFSAFFGTMFTDQMIKSAILIWRTITYYLTIIVSLPFAAVRKKKTEAAGAAETAEAAETEEMTSAKKS